MTNDMMDLRSLVEKTPGADILREMIGFFAVLHSWARTCSFIPTWSPRTTGITAVGVQG
jgi:hypothetical protein